MPVELISDLEMDGIREDMETLFADEAQDQVELCTIYRITAFGAPHPDTAVIAKTRVDLHVDIRCILSQVASRRDNFKEVGNAMTFVRQYQLKVPWDIDDVQIRDWVEMTASRDPGLIGRVFEVRDVVHESHNGVRLLTLHDFRE